MNEFERFFKDNDINSLFLYKYDCYFTIFLKAIHQNDEINIYKFLCKDSGTFKINFLNGESILHVAVRFGSISLVNRIIELGTNINAKDNIGQTPLYRAIQRSTEMVQILLDNGADFEIFDKFTLTVLQRSLLSGSIETVNLLLNKIYSKELGFNQVGVPKNSFEKCRENAQICLDLGVDLNWKHYPTLLHFVSKYGDEEIFKLVLKESKHIDINAQSPEQQTLLHYLVRSDKINLAKIVLDYGANVDQNDGIKRTALYYAIMKNHSKFVRLLLEYGADVHHRNIDDIRPLSYSFKYGSKEVVKMLLDSGADVNQQSASFQNLNSWCGLRSSSFTIFYEACGIEQSKIYREIDVYTHEYKSIIHLNYSEYWNGCSLEIIRLLLERGANVNPRDTNEISPLLVACGAGNFHVVKLLLDFGAHKHERLFDFAVLGNNTDLVSFLLANGYNINVDDNCINKDFLHDDYLYYIINKGNESLYVEMIEFLVDNGVYVNNPHHENILIKAISLRKPEEVVCLLELKATIEVPIKIDRISPYSGYCVDGEFFTRPQGDDMCLRQFTAFLALKEGDMSLYIKKEEETFGYNCDYYYCDQFALNDYCEYIFMDHKLFFQKCRHEIDKMKFRKICDQMNISYFDFLSKELLDVVQFTRCKEIIQVLKSGEYIEKFPCYAFQIEQRFIRVRKLTVYVNNIEYFLEKKVAKQKLNNCVLRTIFSYWNVADVRNFGRALSVNTK